MATEENKKPIVIKVGRGIRAKLWKNQNDERQWYNVTISRCYKGEDDQFHDSDSFSRDDLLHVAYLAKKAFDYIVNDHDEPEA